MSAALCCLARVFGMSADQDSMDSEEECVAPTSQPCNWLKPRGRKTRAVPAHQIKLKRSEEPRRSKRRFRQMHGYDPQHPDYRTPVKHESSMTCLAGRLRESEVVSPGEPLLAAHYDYPPGPDECEPV